MSLDRYMDDFGQDLARAGRTTRRRRRVRLALAFPTAAALAVAAALLPGAGGGGIDAVAQARQALAPANEIVHMVVRFKSKGRIQPPAIEQWYAADPDRWRTRMEFPRPRDGGVRALDRRGVIWGRMENAYSNNRMRTYSAERDVVRIYRNVPRLGAIAGPGMVGGDPATELREQLNAGDLRDDGVVTHDGKQVRRLVRETNEAKGRFRQQFVYYMDPQTFAPVGGRMYYFLRGDKKLGGMEFTISDYQRIPLNAETAKLLRIDKTPNTKFVWIDLKTRGTKKASPASTTSK